MVPQWHLVGVFHSLILSAINQEKLKYWLPAEKKNFQDQIWWTLKRCHELLTCILIIWVIMMFKNLLNLNFPWWLILENKLYFKKSKLFQNWAILQNEDLRIQYYFPQMSHFCRTTGEELASGTTEPDVILRNLCIW